MSAIKPIWIPTQARIEKANLTKFIEHLRHQGIAINNYTQLQEWSVMQSGQFWLELWNFCDVIGFQGSCIVGQGKSRWQLPVRARDTIWFPQAEINYAENLLSYAYQKPGAIALHIHNEAGDEVHMTWQTLCDEVSIMQQWLKRNGVGRGDVVAACLPCIAQNVVALLATTSLGAIWTAAPVDAQINTIIEHFSHLNPKILFCCNGYQFAGQIYSLHHKNAALSQALSSLVNVCEINNIDANNPINDAAQASEPHYSDWDAVISSYAPRGIKYERVFFNDPLFILCQLRPEAPPEYIMHSVGGTLLNHLKEHQFHCDIQPDERVLYPSRCADVLHYWQISVLASGATLVMYDGSPLFPAAGALWQIAERYDVTLLGADSHYFAELQTKHYSPNTNFSLSQLKTLCISGASQHVLPARYIYENIGNDIHLLTLDCCCDICGCMMIGNPLSAVYDNECQGAGLAIDVQTTQLAQTEQSAPKALICVNSLPNYPCGFWHDDGHRYHQRYWQDFPGMWYHGEHIKPTEHGGYILYDLP